MGINLEAIEKAVEVSREHLEKQWDAAGTGSLSNVPLLALNLRESLNWRMIELADGVVLCLKKKNFLSAAVLSRSVVECVALQHQLL